MIECARRSGLAYETLLPRRIGNFTCGQNFNCDKAIELPVVRLVYDAHAALAELLNYLVMRQGTADHSDIASRRTSPESAQVYGARWTYATMVNTTRSGGRSIAAQTQSAMHTHRTSYS